MADHHWPTPTQATSLAQGRTLGACAGRLGSEIVITVANDGVSVLHVETLEILQSWAFQEEEGCEPAGPAQFQKKGGVFCIPMHMSVTNRSSSRRKKQEVASFLYCWRIKDTESKNIRHVSTKVELSSSVSHILPLVCNPRTFTGDQQSLKQYSKGFLVITEDGVANVLNTETSSLEPVDLPSTGNGILSVDCHENGVALAYTMSEGKKKNNVLHVSHLSFGEYPSLRLTGTWSLNVDEAREGSLVKVTCHKDRAVAVFSNGTVLVYEIPDSSSRDDDTISPLFWRRLRLDSSIGHTKGKKRGVAGAPGLDGDLRVFIDSFSRAFICRHDDKSLVKIVTMDLLYGSILWVGCVDRDSSRELVSQVVMSGEESVDVCLALESSRVIRISADIPKATLTSVVGSLCIQNTVKENESTKLNPLALNARLALDHDNLAEINESKRLGKVKINLTPREGFGWIQPAAALTWEPSINPEFEEYEKTLASLVRALAKGGKHDAKSKSEFLKAVTLGLNKCKILDVSFSSEISAGILVALIDAKQWDSVSSLLLYSHPQTLSHCPGAAASLASHARYIELFTLLRKTSDISYQELYSVIKSLISASGPEYEANSETLLSSLSANAEKQIEKAEKFKSTHGNIKVGSDLVTAARMSAAPISGFSRKQLACHPLLALRPNPILICTAMKRLHSQYLIYLIHYLHQWLKNLIEFNVILGGESATCDIALVPSLNTVIQWLTAALDAGNLRLSKAGKSVDVLQKLMDDLEEHIKCFKSFEDLSGILEHLEKTRNQKNHHQKKHSQQGIYSAECFSL